MKYFAIILFLFLWKGSWGQTSNELSPIERAYLFHIVKKSPILNKNFGRFLDYTGPNITFPNGKLNYDSVETIIINQPDLLIIKSDEIAKSSKGLVAEAANKMALWELNKTLHAKRISPQALIPFKNQYEAFEQLLKKQLPSSLLVQQGEKKTLHKSFDNILNPSLSFDDKLVQINSLRFLSIEEKITTLRAINLAINEWTKKRAFSIFQMLGGKAEMFENILIAAGDGSSTSGMLEEREKDEKGRWNKGLPKAVGLFPYDLKKETIKEGKKSKTIIEPLRYVIRDFKTADSNKVTKVHFDVWGYNSEKQTTVVIEKQGISYPLFGSSTTRFLSPDTSFSNGTTYYSIINDLEFKKIADLNKKIHGKHGFDHWIKYHQKKKDQTELRIEKREKEYSDLGFRPIATKKKASAKVKRSKRKARKSGASTFSGAPTTMSNKKNKGKLQNEIVNLYAKFEAHKKKIAEFEKKKITAVNLRTQYEHRLNLMKRLIGLKWATYEVKDGIYTFQDSSQFDLTTQDFTFPPSATQEDFEIKLLAIPESSLSKSADEVMLHINIIDAVPDADARINITLEDVFASDKWKLPSPVFQQKDSISVQLFFESLLNDKKKFKIIARGQGIGKWNGIQTIKDENPTTLNSYNEKRSLETLKRLRKSELIIRIKDNIELEINSYTDPVRSNISIKNPTVLSEATKFQLSKNQILSAHRTATILKKIKSELNILAGEMLQRTDAKKVIDLLNSKIDKTRISVGATSFKLDDL